MIELSPVWRDKNNSGPNCVERDPPGEVRAEVGAGKADPDVLQRGLAVRPLYDDVEELVNPLLGVGAVQVVQQLLPAEGVDVGGSDPHQHHLVQPFLEAGQETAVKRSPATREGQKTT